jgi:hypothetical protein
MTNSTLERAPYDRTEPGAHAPSDAVTGQRMAPAPKSANTHVALREGRLSDRLRGRPRYSRGQVAERRQVAHDALKLAAFVTVCALATAGIVAAFNLAALALGA